MIGALALRDYKVKLSEPQSSLEERESLLGSENGLSGDYQSIAAPKPTAPDPVRRTQVSGTGWLDYFTGFRILFPYLW